MTVREAALRTAGPGILDQLIGNKLIDQEAMRKGIVATAPEVDERIDHIRQLMKPAVLEDSLRGQHMSLADMRNQILVQIEIEKLIAPTLRTEAQFIARERQFQQEAPKYVQGLRARGHVIVYFGTPAAERTGTAAKVNGEPIPMSTVAAMAYRLAGPRIADHMIDTALVDQEATKEKIVVSDHDVDSRIAEIRRSMGAHSFDAMLRSEHTTLAEFRDDRRSEMESDMLVWKALGPIELAHVRQIFLLTNAEAAKAFPGATPRTDAEARRLMAGIEQQIHAGANFSDLAKRYSDDLSTKANGGDAGVVGPQSPWGGDFYQAASQLGPGDVTAEPVQSRAGLHLIMAISTSANHPPSENALYQRAVDRVHAQELQMFLFSYLHNLRGRGKVVNYLEG